jgi:signal transduction histidine kinase
MATDQRLSGPPGKRVGDWSGRYSQALVILGALILLATLILVLRPAGREQWLLALTVACAALAMLFRRWPLPVLAIELLLAAVALGGRIPPLAIGLELGLAVFLVSSRLPRRLSAPAGLMTVALIGSALVAEAFNKPSIAQNAFVIEGLVPLCAAWFVGDAVAARRRYQAGLAEQAAREQAMEAEQARQQIRQERIRMAQELHDVVAHTLAVITVQAGVGRRLMARQPEQASRALESIEEIGRTAQEELRFVLDLLREEGVSGAELSPAPRLSDLQELVATVAASGTGVELRTSGTGPLSPALELSLYRVVQEALTNVVKHAPGATTTVDVSISEQAVRVEVLDSGRPSREPRRAAAAAGPPGHGIAGMRERVGAFGGSLVARPIPNGGFRVVAEVPLESVS